MSVVNGPALPPQLAQDAYDLLTDMSQWQLTAAKWARVDSLLDQALTATNADGFGSAVRGLESCGPPRATSADNGRKGPSQPIREKIDQLKHEVKPGSSGQGKSSGGGKRDR